MNCDNHFAASRRKTKLGDPMRRQLGRSNLECFVVFVGLLGYCHLDLVHGFDRKCVFSPERSQFEYSFPDEIFKGFHGRKEIDDNPSSQDIGGWFRRILWKGKRCGVSVLEGVRVSYSLRGGDISFHSSSFHFGSLDVLARSYSILLAWVVAFQSAIAALFSRREQLFAVRVPTLELSFSCNQEQTSFSLFFFLFLVVSFQIAARLVKSDTIAAVKTIQSIFESVDDHGVVDVFKKYPTQELISALYALSRLQAASDIYSSKPIKEFPLCHDEVLLEDLCHYAPFACAAYGWELDLVTAGRLHRGDLHALVRITNIHENDVVQVEWESRANRPVRTYGHISWCSCLDLLATKSNDFSKGILHSKR